MASNSNPENLSSDIPAIEEVNEAVLLWRGYAVHLSYSVTGRLLKVRQNRVKWTSVLVQKQKTLAQSQKVADDMHCPNLDNNGNGDQDDNASQF